MEKAQEIQWYWEKNWRLFLWKSKNFTEFPDLLWMQKQWFQDFVDHYIHQLFEEVNPIYDIAGEKLYLYITDIKIGTPSESIETCKSKELTYWGIISGKIKLVNYQTNQVIFNRRVNIWTMPIMTQWGSYIINWVERVIIWQIVRSYGIFYSYEKKENSYSFKVIPEIWSWTQIFTEKTGNIVVRINKSRKFPVTALLRVFGYETDESIKKLFEDVMEEEDFDYIWYTLEKDTTKDALDAAVTIYNKIRPGELIDPENAMDYVKSIFLSNERINLGKIARRKVNAKLGLENSKDKDPNLFDTDDFVYALKYLLNLANRKRWYYVDDIDHLSNRRVRTMGEVLYAHLQPVVRKFVKSVKGKLSVLNMEEQIKLTDLVNFKMIDNSIKSFFATSQLSQFLEQMNPLADIEHKRRITALWPGGLKRETTTFEVRDIHQSHYWRICPIETPEWANIWLVINQALYSKVNEDGFLETPAVKLENKLPAKADVLEWRIADVDIIDDKWNVIVGDSNYIDQEAAQKIEKLYWKTKQTIAVRPFLTEEVEYISPEYDEKYIVADITVPLDSNKNILNKRVAARHYTNMEMFHVNDLTHVDVNPSQVLSANTSLIPFVEYDDAVRSAMGTNMQRQTLPLIKPEAPLVWTWLESDIANMTYAVIRAEDEWEVTYVDWKRVKVNYRTLWTREYNLVTFTKSNQKTIIHQYAKVSPWDKIQEWDVLAEWPSVVNGEISIGKNVRVGFMSWEGYNYEDAIVISDRLVKYDELTSVHIEEYEIEVAETKLWPEETTNDIPWVSLSKLTDLDEDWVVRLGSTVKWGDILVGKITPKWEWDLSPEEKLIQAIFGDKSKSYKDTSLYMPSGSEWKVIDVVVLDWQKGDNIPAWVKKKIKLYVASTKKIEVGDKLAGKHWNKWVISVVVPEEDMPFTDDGHPVDIILNPLGVVSRMNVWQSLETQLWMIAKAMWKNLAVPLFTWNGKEIIRDLAVKLNLPEDWKYNVRDWRTWEYYPNRITVGYMNIMKLSHLADDKIHSRSVWPYSLITQQPLGGKAREGWQRFGEMEVWALEAHSAVYSLQEMLTIKSDDVVGRNKTYQNIIKGASIKVTWLPESFNFLTYVLKWIGQNVTALTSEEIERINQERMEKIKNLHLKGITSVDSTKEYEKEEATSDEEKQEIIDNVMQELEDYGEIE